MTQMPYGYYNRFDESKKYEKHLFTAGSGLQSAELNEIQEYSLSRIQNLGKALFKDGDVIADARVVVNQSSGYTQAQAGSIYIAGAVRRVAARNFTIPVSGEVSIGVFLVERVVTSLEDASLRDPAAGTRNYQEPGASRLKIEAKWGASTEDIGTEFFPVYEVADGVVKAKEAPPNMDSVTQALARYDRDSSGGSYVVSGLKVTMLKDSGGNQNYSVSAGRARVNGYAMEFKSAVRLPFYPEPDLNYVDSEPQVSITTGSQRVSLDYTPVANIDVIRITAEKTVTLTHGAYVGAPDQIEDESILQIVEVKQGATVFTANTDYRLTSGKVDWSPGGAEPAPGSTYTVRYQAITVVKPTSWDATGCTVTGAVVGSLILVSYNQYLPRIDRIVVTDDGTIEIIKGVASAYNPKTPNLPSNVLPIASIYQSWTASRRVVNDGIRMVPMNEIAELGDKIDKMFGLIAQQRLESDINVREAGAKKGLFTDPFLDDSQRDQGISQTGAVFDGILTLGIVGNIAHIDSRGSGAISCLLKTNDTTGVRNEYYTGSMKVNPYMAFSVSPSEVVLSPSVDRWETLVGTVWDSPVTRTLTTGFGTISTVTSSRTQNVLVNRSVRPAGELRQIDIQFRITGFGPNESLKSVTFDGIAVTPTAI